jgi:hypothetical protein
MVLAGQGDRLGAVAGLAETFPKTYPGYKRSTKRLVPFIF